MARTRGWHGTGLPDLVLSGGLFFPRASCSSIPEDRLHATCRCLARRRRRRVQALTTWLRKRTPDELQSLLDLRPELPRSAGRDLASLSFWLTQPTTLYAALARLDRFSLQVLEMCQAVAVDEPVDRSALKRAAGDAATMEQVDRALEHLQHRALVWPGPSGLQLPPLTQVLTPRPLGLGSPLRQTLGRTDAASVRAMAERLGLGKVSTKTAALELLADLHAQPVKVQQLLDTAPAEARTLLDKLDAGPGVARDPGSGYYGPRRPSSVPAVEWLVERGLLVPLDWTLLEVPREVGIGLRGGRLVRRLDPDRPQVAGTTPAAGEAVDRAAAGAAIRLLDAATALGDAIDGSPITRLKDGGVGVRELRRLGAGIDQDPAGVTGLLTLLAAAGLLDPGEQVLLDASYDDWLAEPAARRYSELVRAWLRLAQPLSLRKPDGKLLPALVPVSLEPPVDLPTWKRRLLSAHDGAAPAVDDLVRQAAWDEPLVFTSGAEVVIPDMLAEAELLGLLGCGTLSAAGRGLLATGPAPDVGVAGWFPSAVEELLLQADLTAVVPGPPSADLRALLDSAADRESRGGGSTWRFSPASVRRALDGGRTADDLLDRLGAAALHGIPQTLDYLVRDVERQHGRLRIGAAGCYLRCADEALAAEVLVSRGLGQLGLRQVAPAVLIARTDPETTLRALQSAGYAPVVEDESGGAVLQRIGGQRGESGRELAQQLVHQR